MQIGTESVRAARRAQLSRRAVCEDAGNSGASSGGQRSDGALQGTSGFNAS